MTAVTWRQEPIRYVEALGHYYGNMGHPPYDWSVYDDAPWRVLTKPVAECRISLMTSGGISHCEMPPFEPTARNDHRLDEISPATNSTHFQIHDAYYDHRDAERDINCQFPIDRLREFADAGAIASVGSLWSGFMGRIYNRSKVIEESAPAFARALHNDEVDLLIAVPA